MTLWIIVAFSHAFNPTAVELDYQAQSVQVVRAQADDPFPCPAGRYLVFDSSQTGNQEIYRLDLETKNAIQLTHDRGSHEMPAYSHDCSKIAYVSDATGTNQIVVMDARGGNPKQITHGRMDHIHPAWSTDGSHVMFSASRPDPDATDAIVVSSVDGSIQRHVTPGSFGESSYGSWSPYDRLIAYRRIISGENSEVYVMRSDGSKQRDLTNNRAFDGWPSWSPDGRQIAFASNRLEADEKSLLTQVFVMNADGSDVRLVAKTHGRDTGPRWSADGKSLFWAHCEDHTCMILTSPAP